MTGPKSINPNDAPRALKILTRILSLSDEQVLEILGEVFHEFGNRHQRIREVFVERFEQVKGYLPSDRPMSEERKLLIGSYFTSEYSLESAALFNPSIIPHPDQTNLPEGSMRSNLEHARDRRRPYFVDHLPVRRRRIGMEISSLIHRHAM